MSNLNRLSATLSESVVIGALMYHLDWMDAPGVSLRQDDFLLFDHQVLYSIMRERWLERNYEISAEQAALEAEKHPTKGKHTITIEKCINIKAMVGDITLDTFMKEVERLNKLKILRELHKKGFQVERIIGPDDINAKSIVEIIDDFTIDEILNTYRTDIDEISDSVDSRLSRTSIKAGDGLREMIEDLQRTPQVGALLDGDIFNAVVRGAIFGKYYLNSSPTGVGKSRLKIGNAAVIAMPRVIEGGRIEYKKEGYEKILFVTTELDVEEIQLALLATVSNVPEENIKSGTLSFEEAHRLEIGSQIIEMYSENFYIEQIPDPSVAHLKSKIEGHIRKNHVEYIFYDYIFSSPSLNSEFRSVREDVALMYLSNMLKEIATTHNVFMMSSTQVNGSWIESSIRGSNLVRGSKAITDKVDVGMITLDLRDEEFLKIETIIESLGCRVPNLVTDVYKNRGGRLNGIKIFRYFDKDTCRMEDLFITSEFYEVIDLTRFYKEDKITLNTIDELSEKKGEKLNELN